MKPFLTFRATALSALVAISCVWSSRLRAENVTDAIAVVRGTYTSDRQAVVSEAMQLTESESTAFWPLYREYRAEMEKIGDSLVKLVLEYADVYPNVPDDRARQMLKDYTALEKKFVSERGAYLKKFAKILPPVKTLRFAQVESRLDLVLRLQLASSIPLMPTAKAK